MKEDQNEVVTVLTTGDQVIIALAKATLDEAQIPYVVKGEGLQDLFGVGRLGTGYNPIVGPVEIQVALEDEEEAKKLLETLPEPKPDQIE